MSIYPIFLAMVGSGFHREAVRAVNKYGRVVVVMDEEQRFFTKIWKTFTKCRWFQELSYFHISEKKVPEEIASLRTRKLRHDKSEG